MPVGRRQPGVGEANAKLDRLPALVAPAVGLDLGLLLADQLGARQEPDRLDPEPAEVAVARAEPPPPGVVERVEHRLARADELVEVEGQLAVAAGHGGMLGQHQGGRLLAGRLEVPEQLGQVLPDLGAGGLVSPNRKIGLDRPSTVSSGR